MSTGVFMNSSSRRLAGWCAVLAMLVAGCITTEDKRDAVNAINKAFKADYEAILAKDGTRVFKVARAEAYEIGRAHV